MKPSYEELLIKIKDLNEKLRLKDEEFKLHNSEFLRAKQKTEENERMLHTLVETAVGNIGQDFFNNIVIKLADWLNVECVIIGQLFEDNRIYCLPMYLDGVISLNFSYDLANSPCDVTTRKGFCKYEENVIITFPKDKILNDLGAAGYVGTALYNKEGIANGVICAVSRKKLNLPPQTREILKIIGSRVSAEIERKKAIQDLEKSQVELRESNATKDKFFSIIAHDLKNPFNTILGFSTLLLSNFEKYDSIKQKKMINNIQDAAKNASSLLDNLLKWSMAQQNLIKCAPVNIKIKSFVEENIHVLKQMASEKNIYVGINIHPGLTAFADKDMLSTVLRNLITNAIKFTPDYGKIMITACLTPDNNSMVDICIEDNGIGISKKELEKIFKIDYSTTGTKTEKGTGLGLIICKEFMKKQNGSLKAESKIGVGSKFIIALPVNEI